MSPKGDEELCRSSPLGVTRGPCEVTRGTCEFTRGPCEVTRGPCEDTRGPCEDTRGPCEVTRGPCEDTRGPFEMISEVFDVNKPLGCPSVGREVFEELGVEFERFPADLEMLLRIICLTSLVEICIGFGVMGS